jgi:hypothetical protein
MQWKKREKPGKIEARKAGGTADKKWLSLSQIGILNMCKDNVLHIICFWFLAFVSLSIDQEIETILKTGQTRSDGLSLPNQGVAIIIVRFMYFTFSIGMIVAN